MKSSIIMFCCCMIIATIEIKAQSIEGLNVQIQTEVLRKPDLKNHLLLVNDNTEATNKLKSVKTVSKTVHLDNPGSLNSVLTKSELENITDLILTGTIDARDFRTMRDSMNVLSNADLNGTEIVSYTGIEGTDTIGVSKVYSANTVPNGAFWNPETHDIRNLTSLILPNTIRKIGNYAFLGNTNLASFNIPASVTEIGNYTFQKCSKLESMEIPSSVHKIGAYAVSYTGLTSIEIPASISEMGEFVFWHNTKLASGKISSQVIGDGAFYECVALNSVVVSETVQSIGESAFEGNHSLAELTLSEGLVSIGIGAFWDCSGLLSVNIPSTVTFIGSGAFRYCGSSITVNSDNQNYSNLDGVLFNKNQTILIQIPISKAGSYSIPSTVKYVQAEAFAKDTLLNSVIIPESVSNISTQAFYYCKRLTSVYSYGKNPPELNDEFGGVFRDVELVSDTLFVPQGTKSAYQSANQWKDFGNIMEIETTGIEEDLFSNTKVYTDNNSIIVQLPQVLHNTIVSVYDLNGRLIQTQKISASRTTIPMIDNGVYLVRIEDGSQVFTEKVITQ